MTPVKIAVAGARGRMGLRIIALARQDRQLEVLCGLEREGHPDIGKTVDGVFISSSFRDASNSDCVIDFTSPHALEANLKGALGYKKPVVIGTTGMSGDDLKKIRDAAVKIPVVYSPNMSVGVNLVFSLLNKAGMILNEGYQVRVSEAHHIHKKDSPSGTAKKIVQILNENGFSVRQEDVSAVREDEIVGDHKVVFESGVDRIEISHSAKTRDIFAQGALLAAKWVSGKDAGLFSMSDVLFQQQRGEQ